jgi:nucleotidyltransferase/DNA polymerase involved in DNA repair
MKREDRQMACLWLPHFMWQLEIVQTPELADDPVVLIGDAAPGSTGSVVVDRAPQLHDIDIGMRVSTAQSRRRDIVLVQAKTFFAEEQTDALANRLQDIIPDVEIAEPGLIHVGIWGAELLYGSDAEIIKLLANAIQGQPFTDVRLGVGQNKWLSFIAATLSEHHKARKLPLDSSSVLHRLSVDVLPVPLEMKTRLRSFGIRSLGDLTHFPRGSLEAQFGPDGGRAWLLAKGIDDSPLVPRVRVEQVSEEMGFDVPSVVLPTVLTAIEGLLETAYSSNEIQRRSARAAEIILSIYRRAPQRLRISFKTPAQNTVLAMGPITTKLEAVTITGPVENVRLTLSELTVEAGRQSSYMADTRQQALLREALTQIRTHTAQEIYYLRATDPCSPIPEERDTLIPASV